MGWSPAVVIVHLIMGFFLTTARGCEADTICRRPGDWQMGNAFFADREQHAVGFAAVRHLEIGLRQPGLAASVANPGDGHTVFRRHTGRAVPFRPKVDLARRNDEESLVQRRFGREFLGFRSKGPPMKTPEGRSVKALSGTVSFCPVV